MEGLEWMARYIKFIPRNNVLLAAKDFKAEFMTSLNSPERVAITTLNNHHTEGIQTIIINIRDAKNKLETSKLTIKQYDELNCLNCSLLEGLVLNDQSNNMMVQMQGISDVCRIMQE